MRMSMDGCSRSRGFSLIEVLVALLIIAIGVLGAVALQTRAIEAGMETYQRTQALLLVEDMVNRMRNNKAEIRNCYSKVGTTATGFVGTGAGTPPTGCDTVADQDLVQWQDLLLGAAEYADATSGEKVGGILGARGCIKALASDGEYRVSVAWQGLSRLGAEAGKDSCAQGAYEGDNFRRVVGLTIRVSDLR